jgi:hypothetical protein
MFFPPGQPYPCSMETAQNENSGLRRITPNPGREDALHWPISIEAIAEHRPRRPPAEWGVGILLTGSEQAG